jgi:Subtilase family/Secretion system C-terminal sorting domain
MKKLIIVLIGNCLLFSEIHAQFTRYVVKLKNKGGSTFSLSNPTAYLSQRAIDRRTRYGIAIDSTDMPVTPSYITQIRNVPNVIVLNISKWQNSVSIQTSDPNAITTINGLSFVQSVAPIAAQTQNNTIEKLTVADQPYNAIGDIFVKTSLADTVGLSSWGGATYTIVGNKLKMDMSTITSPPSPLGIIPRIESDSVTSLDAITAEAIVSFDTMVTYLVGYGTGIAIYGREMGYSVQGSMYGANDANLGKLFIRGGNEFIGTTLAISNGQVPSIDVGDSIIYKLETFENTVTFSARNLTDNSDWVSVTYTYIGTEIKHSIGHVAITQGGGRMFLHQFKYSSKQVKKPYLYLWGDSKFTKSTTQNESLVSLLKNNYGQVYANSGAGDYTNTLLTNRWEVMNIISPKKVLIETSNDIRYGVSPETWQANLTQLYNEFTAAGIDVYFTSFYETAADQSAMDTWLVTNYPLKYIRRAYTDLASTPGVLLGDNTHLSAFGNQVARDAIVLDGKLETGVTDFFNYGTGSLAEINLHKGQFLHNIGLRGQGVVIAILDGGFFNYTTLDAMDSIILNNQVLDTWDFYSQNSTVSDDHPHGMQCLSTIAANIPGLFIGKAPKANFMLYRTEDVNSEYPIEEFNMVCGMERADSAGADVISASIGYSEFDDASFNHTYAQMDGNTTIAATGADLAARKGILVVAATGNEGGAAWHYIITPADGDSVLAVGAVNTSGAVGSFSSYGPSGDGQVKPDVASVGVNAMVQSTANTVATGSGTSFACPNMAGLSSILWQAFPEVNNMRIARALREAGSISATPDDRIGYGIPDLKAAFGKLLTEFATSTSTIDTCTATVSWISKDVSAMKYEIERKLPGQSAYTKVGELFPQPGNLLAIHSYQFSNTIINTPPGSVSYRIRQIIDTALSSFTAVYIDTTAISITSGCFADFLVSTSTSSATINNCTATVNWSSKDNGAMRYEIERKLPGEPSFTKIADMPAQPGNVLSKHSYSFNNTIINSPSGMITYRIRQIIDTASASFAGVYLQSVNVNISDLCFANYLINTATSSTTINGCSITVSWSSNDYGAMKYEIERKAPGETNFSKVGELSATTGLSLAIHNYQFINTVATGSSGTFSYRIRQIIDTAAVTFTAVFIDTTVATLASSCVFVTRVVTIRPNPSIGSSATLIIETADAIQSMPILVYNMNGRLVQRLQESKDFGKKIIDLSVGKLAKGKYFINVYNKNILIGTTEFIKL